MGYYSQLWIMHNIGTHLLFKCVEIKICSDWHARQENTLNTSRLKRPGESNKHEAKFTILEGNFEGRLQLCSVYATYNANSFHVV